MDSCLNAASPWLRGSAVAQQMGEGAVSGARGGAPTRRSRAKRPVDDAAPTGSLREPRHIPHRGRQLRGVAPLGVPIDPLGWPTRPFLAFASLLARYHRHRVAHLERLARPFAEGRRVLL